MICDYKCYTKCPQGVFHVHSTINRAWTKPDPNSPKHYIVVGSAAPKCIGCMECTEHCPVDAITIEIERTKIEEGQHPYGHPFESLEVGLENQMRIDELDSKYKGLKKI